MIEIKWNENFHCAACDGPHLHIFKTLDEVIDGDKVHTILCFCEYCDAVTELRMVQHAGSTWLKGQVSERINRQGVALFNEQAQDWIDGGKA